MVENIIFVGKNLNCLIMVFAKKIVCTSEEETMELPPTAEGDFT